jgi:hypothetical protein
MNLLICFVVAFFSVLLLVSCGGASKSNDDGTTQYDIPLQLLVNEVEVKANQTTHISFTYDFPFYTPAFTEFSVDLNETLKDVNIKLPNANNKLSSAGITGRIIEQVQMYAYVSSASQANFTCSSGERYGPFMVDVENSNQAKSITPAKASATRPTLSVINAGSFTLCLEIVSPVEAKIDVDGVTVDAKSCGQEPADISGVWSGTYSCTNQGTSNDGGDIILTITQKGYSASYTDGEATYEGTVCGNVFEYDGGVPFSYDEDGKFILNTNGTGSKNSTWTSIDGKSSGVCEDSLSRDQS